MRRRAIVLSLVTLLIGSCDLQVQQDTRPFIEAMQDVSPDPSTREPNAPEVREPDASEAPTATPSATETTPGATPTQRPPDEPTPPQPGQTPDEPGPSQPTAAPADPTEATPTTAPRPNRAPFARDDRATTSDGRAVDIDVLANDADPDGDELFLVRTSRPDNGSVSFRGAGLRYTPDPSFEGVDTFTYTIADGELDDTALVHVTVELSNRAPVANPDSGVVQQQSTTSVKVLANDFDPDGDEVTIQIISAPSQGTAQVSGESILYQHTNPRSLTDRFTYRLVDPEGAASETVAVTISVNRSPVARDDHVRTSGTEVVVFNVLTGSGTSGGTANADTDPDGDNLLLGGVTSLPDSAGTLSCSSDGRCEWKAPNNCRMDVDVTLSYSLQDGRGGADTGALRLQQSLLC